MTDAATYFSTKLTHETDPSDVYAAQRAVKLPPLSEAEALLEQLAVEPGWWLAAPLAREEEAADEGVAYAGALCLVLFLESLPAGIITAAATTFIVYEVRTSMTP